MVAKKGRQKKRAKRKELLQSNSFKEAVFSVRQYFFLKRKIKIKRKRTMRVFDQGRDRTGDLLRYESNSMLICKAAEQIVNFASLVHYLYLPGRG